MEKAARGAQPEEEERTDGELNWVQRARLASEVGAETPRIFLFVVLLGLQLSLLCRNRPIFYHPSN